MTQKQTCEILPKMDSAWIYLFYCKCRKSEGNPIIVKTNNKEYYARKIKFRTMGDFDMEYNNSPKKIAQRGATTVLQFPVSDYTFKVLKKDQVLQVKGKPNAKNYTVYKQ